MNRSQEEEKQISRRAQSMIGCLHGMAVGDALGLPLEKISRSRQCRLYPELRHRFVGRYGMVSDDTEHACMTVQAVICSGGDPEQFVRSLAWRLRFWLLGLPAGAGMATLRSIFKLWCGCSGASSGVHSAGNGPAMRSPVLGVLFAEQPVLCREVVRRATAITHTDPKAHMGALVVAIAAREAALHGALITPSSFEARLEAEMGVEADELMDLIHQVTASVERGESTADFACELGLEKGVTGYMYHTVPVVLHAWLTSPTDYRRVVEAVVACGGDTDTMAAIAGGIVGAAVGTDGIPLDWRAGVAEWPCGMAWMKQLGARSAEVTVGGHAGVPLSFNRCGQMVRNLFFLLLVLLHGFRRMLPPY